MTFSKRARITFLAMIILSIFSMSIFVERDLEGKVSAESDSYEDLKLFSEVLSTLQRNYVEPVKSKELMYGAVKGMLNTLDAHSAFMPPEVYREMQVDTKGNSAGWDFKSGRRRIGWL
ncbi:MAG: hypothetical protein MPW14_01925 [Candidatus Manganitrophus sp.]|nr:MAG: hypothetical protein MPW14_01925 [Candidatus Manganitrophus sp.]